MVDFDNHLDYYIIIMIIKKKQFVKLCVNLWSDQYQLVFEIAQKERVSKTQKIRELVDLGLRSYKIKNKTK